MASLTSLLDQSIATIPSFELECGTVLRDVPIAYKTWGNLNETRDNVMIICHAFTGSADVEDWWGPLMGRGKAFDSNKFFIFAQMCWARLMDLPPLSPPIPTLGVPMGLNSRLRRSGMMIHKLVLDVLGVRSVAIAIGGSMGGMAVLEWPLCTPPGYIRHVIPLATSARHSAWCISWGEAQRQSIYSDPIYQDGFYASQPASGLAAARMSALLTYRSRDSFESRFGRKPQLTEAKILTPPASPKSPAYEALYAHNDGHRNAKPRTPPAPSPKPQIFSAQSYLRYQGDKFTSRFDANCYIHITRKMDTHDVSRDRLMHGEAESLALARVLSTLPHRALVISIETDGLFTTTEQRELAAHIPQADLVVIPSPDGHDGFLLEFEQINTHILGFLRRQFPHLYQADAEEVIDEGFEAKKTSIFGEAEVDITRW
ncbi:Alpha/Beta hydrolase protein [Infundibulicybe gibba]|nr:Alpha/Beta hydrolase protein [Infundibulicybe gibba]